MRMSRLAMLASVSLTWLALTISPSTVSAQSLEERYDATLAAYNSTLTQLERCDESFAEFQQFFKEQRPLAGAPKDEWDTWAKAYRSWVDLYTGCMGKLKKQADDLKKKLDELERQLDSLGSDTETKAPPQAVNEKAQNLLNKGKKDLEGWTIGVRYKIRQIDGWSRKASDDVKEHGSGEVKIEPRFEYKF